MRRQQSATFAKKEFKHKCTNDENCRKVNQHCHYTCKYRGASYSLCNLKYCIPKEIPVVLDQWIKLLLPFYH